MNDMNGPQGTNAGKVYKSNQKKSKEQSELFYVKKRGLFRKAEQVVRYCNSEVFIIVHNLDNDKIFSFTSDQSFNLEKISTLVLRDCQQGAYLNKNRKFENTDFEKVRHNITAIQKLNSNTESNPMSSPMLQHHTMDKDGVPDDSITEDMSVSMQQIGSNNEGSAPNNAKLIRSPKNNQVTFNSHSNTGTFENGQFSPRAVPQPNMDFYGQQQQPVQLVNYANHGQFMQNAPPGPTANGMVYPAQNVPVMTQAQRANQQQPHAGQDFNMNGPAAQPYQPIQKSPMRPGDNFNNQQMQGSPRKLKASIYPFGGAGTSNVESNQSFENQGQVNDVNHYRNQEYKQRFQKQQLDHAVNNDDIFTCYDFDYPRQQQVNMAGQSMINKPHQSQLAAGVPGASGVDKRQNPFTKNSSAISGKPHGNTIKVPNSLSGVSQHRSDVSGTRKFQQPPKLNSLVNERPGRENNFGNTSGVHPHAQQLYSPSSHIGGDVADQVLTSPRHAPMANHRVKAVRRYTGLHPEQRGGVISQAHISQISVDKHGYGMGSQVSEDQLDDPQYANQRQKITSGVLMAASQIHQPTFGANNQMGNFGGQEPQQRHHDGRHPQEKGQLYMQSIGEQHIYNISYNYPQGQRKGHVGPGGMMVDDQRSKNYSQVRNHSPAPGEHKVHSQEIYKESKMNTDMQYEPSHQYNQTTGNEFRVSDVVINNNDKEFYPMRAEQEGFNVSVSMPQNKSFVPGSKNLSQLSRERRRSGSGNNSNGSGVRSNRSNTFIQHPH